MKMIFRIYHLIFVVIGSLFIFPLFGKVSTEYVQEGEVATTEGLPSNLVNQSVCVISGEYTDSIVDIVLPGPEPLVIRRQYGNDSPGNFGGFWSLNHYDKLILGHAIYDQEKPIWLVVLRQPSGAQLDYMYPKSQEALKKKDLQFQLILPKGITNGSLHLSGQTNLKNQEVHFYPDKDKIVTKTGAGHRRTFVKIGYASEGEWPICGQQNEEKVNGSLYTYERAVGLIMPTANTDVMLIHLEHIAASIPNERHAVIVLDRAT